MFLNILCCTTHRKTPVLRSLFNNTVGLKVSNFIRNRLHQKYFRVFRLPNFYRTPLVGASENELLNSSSRFFYLNECFELSRFSALRSISQYRNRWAIHLHYISITQLAGKESSTT